MKLLLCSNIKLGAVSTEKLDIQLSHKWQSVRSTRFDDLMDHAARSNAHYVLLAGQLFGQARVTESLIDKLFELARDNADIQFIALLIPDEFLRISYRKDIPENLHVIDVHQVGAYQVDELSIYVRNNDVEVQLSEADILSIGQNTQGYYIASLGAEEYCIPIMEPIGFEDAADTKSGYSLLTVAENTPAKYSIHEHAAYVYKAIEIRIQSTDDQKEILRKINSATREIQRNCFLRVTLTGRSAFGLTIDSAALKVQLQNRIFFVDVYNNTVMDTDEDAFETDISLRSEFVRLALADESLSESERNRIISCGWNALSGKEVYEE